MIILTIVGARPQFIKAAAISKAYENEPTVRSCRICERLPKVNLQIIIIWFKLMIENVLTCLCVCVCVCVVS